MTVKKNRDIHLIVSPGQEEGTFLTESGEKILPPEDWGFLPAGDAGVTRRVKSKGPVWVVQITRGRRTISKGIWADSSHIRTSKQEVMAKRATPAYARQQERAVARRTAEQEAYVAEFYDRVLLFLNFHKRYTAQAKLLGKKITDHATPVGSKTVARTKRISIDKRAEAAVIAWMRHQTTAYDSMKIARVKGKRREVRRMLAQTSILLLNAYRKGEDIDMDCPLKTALENPECLESSD